MNTPASRGESDEDAAMPVLVGCTGFLLKVTKGVTAVGHFDC